MVTYKQPREHLHGVLRSGQPVVIEVNSADNMDQSPSCVNMCQEILDFKSLIYLQRKATVLLLKSEFD